MPGVAQAQAAVTFESFSTGRSLFHRRTLGLLTEIFGSSKRAFELTYFTNLTKCEKAYPPLTQKDWSIPSATRRTCAGLYLRRELEIVAPRAVIAFGNDGDYAEVLGVERTIAVDHPRHRDVGPSWLRGPSREELVARTRALIAGNQG